MKTSKVELRPSATVVMWAHNSHRKLLWGVLEGLEGAETKPCFIFLLLGKGERQWYSSLGRGGEAGPAGGVSMVRQCLMFRHGSWLILSCSLQLELPHFQGFSVDHIVVISNS